MERSSVGGFRESHGINEGAGKSAIYIVSVYRATPDIVNNSTPQSVRWRRATRPQNCGDAASRRRGVDLLRIARYATWKIS